MSEAAAGAAARKIPYVDLAGQHRELKEELLAAVEAVLDHGWFILGPEVGKLECQLAERLATDGQAPFVVGVNSGTDALVMALKLREIGPGDEVITASHSFVATASAIALVGATPVFADIDDETMLIDPAAVEAAITPRTRAVVPVHLNGHPCEMTPLVEICRGHGIELIEDAAQALCARHRGRAAGTFGIGAFSLHPLKVLSACGDAGFISVAEREDFERLCQMRNIGLVDRDHCGMVSGNSRLDTLQAALMLVKMRHLDGWIEARRARARRYREALEGRLRLPPADGADEPVHSAFVVRHPQRDALQAALERRGVDAKIHYPLAIHQQAAFAHLPPTPLPVTERVVGEILSLPVTPQLSAEDQERVIEATLESLDEVEGR